ncbi:hypothetical protein C8J57DRAFT_1229683 [Mycena rebaudengoi]|nr:hypothetical protein C8J57DRAFT_1229683 [Mycena rebaudengoi]
MAGEVDCVKSSYWDNPGPEHYHKEVSGRLPFLCVSYSSAVQSPPKIEWARWNTQSYLRGNPEIFAGFRDSPGIVRSVEAFAVLDPTPVAQSKLTGRPESCNVSEIIAPANLPEAL